MRIDLDARTVFKELYEGEQDMFGLHSKPPMIRFLAGALALIVLSNLLLISLAGFAIEGAGKTLQSWQFVGMGLAGFFLALAFFFRQGRRWTFGAAVALAVAAAGVRTVVAWEVRQEAALLQVAALEPDMQTYLPVADNPRLARLDGAASLKLPAGNLPRLDGATALYPLYAAFVAATWPAVDEGTLAQRVQVSKTPQAYERLFAREADIIFVAKPSKAQVEKARSAGLDLQLTPIGREAFVFYVSTENPVTGLTREQVRGIYAGTVKDWRELGGRPGEIRAFQRPPDSGSQSMMEKIMGETPLMEAPTKNVVQGMGGVVSQTRDYTNYPGAIGYSFRVFVANILQAGGIRLLTIDGVAPTEGTIADGSYPFTAEFYAATIGPPSGETQRFIDWIRSPEGQTLVRRTGYVGLAGK